MLIIILFKSYFSIKLPETVYPPTYHMWGDDWGKWIRDVAGKYLWRDSSTKSKIITDYLYILLRSCLGNKAMVLYLLQCFKKTKQNK